MQEGFLDHLFGLGSIFSAIRKHDARCSCSSATARRRRALCSPVVGEAQLVAASPGINDPVLIEVEQIGVVVPVVRLAPPVCLLLVHQLPCVLAQQIALVGLLLRTSTLYLALRAGCIADVPQGHPG